MANLSKQTRDRLEIIRDVVLMFPEQVDMDDFYGKSEDFQVYDGEPDPVNHCGTTACVAGWARSIARETGAPITSVFTADAALEWLGLTYEQSSRLFYLAYHAFRGEPHWPANYEDKYWKKTGPSARANVVAERIEWFLYTDGTDIDPAKKAAA